jgi:hypothetical protein
MKPGAETKLKFKQLKRRLKLAHWQVVGILETLWRVTEANTPEGDIGRLTDDEIAAAFEWEGDASELVAALIDCRWIDRNEAFRLIVHDWSIHCPNHLKGNLSKYGKQFADVLAREAPREAPRELAKEAPREARMEAPTSPLLSLPIHSSPNHSISVPVSCTETPSVSVPDEVIFSFPCDGTPAEWELTRSQEVQWSQLFPSLDVLAESRAAMAWILADPARKKTAKGMKRFLVGWLGRSQNRGGRTRHGSPQLLKGIADDL